MFKPGIFTLFCGLLLVGAAARGVTLKERFDKTVPLRAGSQVQLTNVNGGVTFEAWDRDEVRIEAEKQVKVGDAERARKALAQIRIEVAPVAVGLRIDTRMPEKSGGLWDALFGHDVNYGVTYTVHVPRKTAVVVQSSNGGIELRGTQGSAQLKTSNGALAARQVTGDLELRTSNGAITVERSAGALVAETTNGHIEAALTGFPAGAGLSLESSNGGIDVQLPRDARFSIDAETSNGRVETEFQVPRPAGGRHNRLEADVNGGGAKLQIRTSNGGVHIRPL